MRRHARAWGLGGLKLRTPRQQGISGVLGYLVRAMLFKVRFHPGILDGTITVTYRAWKKPLVVPGHRYRFGLRHATNDYLLVDSIEPATLSGIRAADARQAGYQTRSELLADLKPYLEPGARLYRITFHYADNQVDARVALRQDLASERLQAVVDRLRAMDERAPHGPWTRTFLTLIRDHPLTAASTLAPMVGQAVLPFKADVRKLKALGLTVSHPVGYELSPRGQAVLKMMS